MKHPAWEKCPAGSFCWHPIDPNAAEKISEWLNMPEVQADCIIRAPWNEPESEPRA